jgi:hypothetical protein
MQVEMSQAYMHVPPQRFAQSLTPSEWHIVGVHTPFVRVFLSQRGAQNIKRHIHGRC